MTEYIVRKISTANMRRWLSMLTFFLQQPSLSSLVAVRVNRYVNKRFKISCTPQEQKMKPSMPLHISTSRRATIIHPLFRLLFDKERPYKSTLSLLAKPQTIQIMNRHIIKHTWWISSHLPCGHPTSRPKSQPSSWISLCITWGIILASTVRLHRSNMRELPTELDLPFLTKAFIFMGFTRKVTSSQNAICSFSKCIKLYPTTNPYLQP